MCPEAVAPASRGKRKKEIVASHAGIDNASNANRQSHNVNNAADEPRNSSPSIRGAIFISIAAIDTAKAFVNC